MKNTKKRIERSVLEAFRNKYPRFPKGKIKQVESPDFILQVSRNNKIGIELSRAVLSSRVDATLANIDDNNHKDMLDLLYNQITLIIEKKEQLLWLYKKHRLNSYWLLIYYRDNLSLNNINLNNHIDRWIFSSSFSQVLLFNYDKGNVYPLNKSQ